MSLYLTGFFPDQPHYTDTRTWTFASAAPFPATKEVHKIRASGIELSFLCARLEGIRKPRLINEEEVFSPSFFEWACPHDIQAILCLLRQFDIWSRSKTGGDGGAPLQPHVYEEEPPAPIESETSEEDPYAPPSTPPPHAIDPPTDPFARTWPYEVLS